MPDKPFVSVVIPCRNEVRFIQSCIRSVLTGDYPPDRLEIIAVDGASEDGTAAILQRLAAADPRVRLVPNPRCVTPVAMNLGIRAARGDVIVIIGAHAQYPPDYVTKSVNALVESGADNVGGVMRSVPQDGAWSEAIAAVSSHWFGVGRSRFRVPPVRRTWVDTVFGGCYRRAVFERVGLMNERLVRGQDMEFNIRLRRSGGRTLLDPAIHCDYFPRSTLPDFWRHAWTNGVWAVVPFLHSPVMPVSWRHLVPLGFVLAVATLALAGAVTGLGWWPLAVIGGTYMAVAVAVSVATAVLRRRPLLALVMPPCFFALHFGYGLGSLRGVVQVAGEYLRGSRRPDPRDAWPPFERTARV